ncbi:glycosyltransferase family 4 protein [uncultured Desulfosarcina sp.]|uniref:glycosyltransferase family 4 protein n=1 Tax=uncultured Desulfosarcina sp. TaxID=218289 RepID=UPI00374989E4
MADKKYHVLAIAEAANPEWVSVPLVGWSHVAALRKITRCHLVTQIRNAQAIIRAGLSESEFTAIDSEKIAKAIYNLGTRLRGGSNKGWTTITALSSLSYYYFEYLVWKQFGESIRNGHFDIVHRITPLSPTIPSILAKKCAKAGVPFVIGPLNGGAPWPKTFDKLRRKEREWLSYMRFAYKLLPGYRATRKYASKIIIGSQFTWQQMPHKFRHKCIYMPENAIDPSRFNVQRARHAELPIQVIFIGRLVPYKGADMLVEAATPLIQTGVIQLTIIGDGPQHSELRNLIEHHKIAHGVKMAGWVEHKKIQSYLSKADLFAFPSIREFGGGAVLEAMAVGVSPIVMNYGGPAELVTPETGYLVEMSDRVHIIESFRALLGEIANAPEELEKKCRLARERVNHLYTWDAKAKKTAEVYEWVLKRQFVDELTGTKN